MKRIAIVAHGLSNGGAERVATNLANYFAENYSVLYVAAFSDVPGYFVDDRVTVKAIHTDKSKNVLRLLDRNKKILKEIKEFQPETVISFITNELLFTQLSGFSMIYSLRIDPAAADRSLIEKLIRRYEYSHAKKVVFQTRGAKEYYSAKIQNNAAVISNPMKCDTIPFWMDCEHNKTFVTACRLDSQKNIPMLIEAFVKFHALYPEYRLDIYGSGELKDEIQSMIQNKGANDYISLKGYSDSIHEVMAKSFAFVLSSDYEGLSNSMLEALAVGMPCVCTDCPPGGAREYITDGVNGILTPVGDADKMFENMARLVDGSIDLNAMSNNAVKIRENIEFKNVCKKWESLL